ncbi:hypothetical protein DH2020_022186 [Rehmannia glutinosa]|uniref:Pectinesterase n=1 Tax=Rehmannia glutinosa TaxID=99300 RepID=A0ABR0WFH9_REHGL
MARDPVQFSPKSIKISDHDHSAALERASTPNPKPASSQPLRSKRKTIVYRDCNNLIDNTILQLNITLQSIQTNASFTDFDAQTWLSTALTNIEICRSGSHDLNVTKFSSPILSGNVSELISNSLATNGALLDNSSNTYGGKSKKQGFPGWVTNRDRKLLQDLELATRANVVVSKDGRGHFRSIQAAINYATGGAWGMGGWYTVITGSRSVSSGFTTYSSATVARGITFRNTAGPAWDKAVALRSASDLSVFYACGFEGYQDTLFVHAQRQFYKSCYIYGTIDFILNAAVVFQNRIIYVRKTPGRSANVITARGAETRF